MKILCLQTAFNLNAGGAHMDFQVLSQLSKLGHTVRIVMPRISQARGPIPVGAQVHYVSARGLKFPQSLGLTCLPGIIREARNFRPDIIRDHSPYTFAWATLMVSHTHQMPAIGVFHHPEMGLNAKYVERHMLKHYEHVTTDSKFSAGQLLKSKSSLREKISTVYCGVDSDIKSMPLNVDRWRVQHKLPPDGPIFCAVGALVPRKNHLFLLEVFQQWLQTGGTGRLIIVGEGPDEPRIRQAIRQRQLAERVVIWPHLEQAAYVELLNAANILLFPSLMEGFGLVPAEAMACGLPVIVSDRGSLPEVVRDGVTGIVVPIDQGPELWVGAIKRLHDDSVLRQRLRHDARIDAQTRFSWDQAGRETAKIYQQVIEEYKRGA